MSTEDDTATEKYYASGTAGGVGFGNKTSNSSSSDSNDNDLRFGKAKSNDPYSGPTKYGSGATAGVGAGNKLTAVSSAQEVGEATEDEDTRLGLSADTNPYSGSTGYGSGSTAGVGYGNKTADNMEGDSHNDSTGGKVMERVGGMFGMKGMQKKGLEKRQQAGFGQDLKDVDGVDEVDGPA